MAYLALGNEAQEAEEQLDDLRRIIAENLPFVVDGLTQKLDSMAHSPYCLANDYGGGGGDCDCYCANWIHALEAVATVISAAEVDKE